MVKTPNELADVLEGLADIGSGKSELRDNIREAADMLRSLSSGERIDGTATNEGDEWRFEEGGIVGDPKATLIVNLGG